MRRGIEGSGNRNHCSYPANLTALQQELSVLQGLLSRLQRQALPDALSQGIGVLSAAHDNSVNQAEACSSSWGNRAVTEELSEADLQAHESLVDQLQGLVHEEAALHQRLVDTIRQLAVQAEAQRGHLEAAGLRATKCRGLLLGERNRRHNASGAARLLVLPVEVQRRIFRRTGKEVRQVCKRACDIFGAPGTGIQLMPDHTGQDFAAVLPRLQAWRHPEAVQKMLISSGFNPEHPGNIWDDLAPFFPNLCELTSHAKCGGSLPAVPIHLTSLKSTNAVVTPALLPHLSSLRSLDARFAISNTDEALRLTHLRNLTHLNMRVNWDDTRIWDALAALPHLASINVGYLPVAISAVSQLQHLTHIEALEGMHTQNLTAMLRPLHQVPTMASLKLTYTGGMGRLPFGTLLQTLRLSRLELDNAFLQDHTNGRMPDCGAMTTLTYLTLRVNQEASAYNAPHPRPVFHTLFPCPCNIRVFRLHDLRPASVPTFLQTMAANLPHLTYLELGLDRAPHLQTFQPVDAATAAALPIPASLRHLTLYTYGEDPHMAAVLPRLTTLSSLHLGTCISSFAPQHVPYLEALPHLPQIEHLAFITEDPMRAAPAEMDLVDQANTWVGRSPDSEDDCEEWLPSSCLEAAQQVRGLRELDVVAFGEKLTKGTLARLLPPPPLLARLCVSRLARPAALKVLGPYVDEIWSR